MKGFVFFFFIISGTCMAQFHTDSLFMAKQGPSYSYFKGEKKVRFFDVIEVTKVNPKSRQLMKYAKNNYTASNFFFGLGVISIAFGSLYYLDSGDSGKILEGAMRGAFVGGMMIGISIPLRRGMIRNTRQTIEVYNQGLPYPYTGY